MSEDITGYPRLTPAQKEAARHLLGFYGKPGGIPPGRFHLLLIKTMEAADHYNRGRILRAFPEFEPAVTIAQINGLDVLANTIGAQK